MITNTTQLSESHNLDLLDTAALDAFASASEPKADKAQVATKADPRLSDGEVNTASIREDFLKPVLDAEPAAVSPDAADRVDAWQNVVPVDAPTKFEPIDLEPVKLPTNFTEYWAVTERPKTFTGTYYLLKTTAAPVTFAARLLTSLTLSMTRMVSNLFRPTMKPTPDAGEVLLEQIATQRKDDQQALRRIRDQIRNDVATAERKSVE